MSPRMAATTRSGSTRRQDTTRAYSGPARPYLPVPGAGHRQRRQHGAAAQWASPCPPTARRPTSALCRPSPQTPTNVPPAPPTPPVTTVAQPAVHPGAAGHPLVPVQPRNRSEFTTVLTPFQAEAFATGIAQSQANIGPMAIVVLPDGWCWSAAAPIATSCSTSPRKAGPVGHAAGHPAVPDLRHGAGCRGQPVGDHRRRTAARARPRDRSRSWPVRRQPDPEPGHRARHRPDLCLLGPGRRDLQSGHLNASPISATCAVGSLAFDPAEAACGPRLWPVRRGRRRLASTAAARPRRCWSSSTPSIPSPSASREHLAGLLFVPRPGAPLAGIGSHHHATPILATGRPN